MPSIELFEKPDQKDKSRTVLYAALDDLCACSNKLEFRVGSSFVRPEFRLLDEGAREVIVRNQIFPKKDLKTCEVLVVSATVRLSSYDDLSWSGDESDTPAAMRVLARVEFCKHLSDLLVMANIARVGAIELHYSVVVQDNEALDVSEIPKMEGYSVQQAAIAAEQLGWPRLVDLDIQTVWRWVTKHHQMMEGFDGTTMGRAIAAFSRLFEHKTADEPMQLLWALVGLEALYVTGKAELAQQLRERAQVLLGPQESFKKKLTRMYDFRSRFVHGKLDFPGLCLFGEAREAVARYDHELLEAIAVAVALLAGTIQEVVRRDWAGLRFGYTVADSANSAAEPIAPPDRGGS
jgi:Apea-like HEPN